MCMYCTHNRLVMAESKTISEILKFTPFLGKMLRIQIVNQTRLKCSERHLLTFRLNNSSRLDQQKLNKCDSRTFHHYIWLRAILF